jgi:hypothetical protein
MAMDPDSPRGRALSSFYWITHRLAQGPFAGEARCDSLRANGITHILNVSEAPSIARAEAGGFLEVLWEPLDDFTRIPISKAIACIETLHRTLAEPHHKVYIHCIAGQQRSPTILWLYFLACGLEPLAAKELIESCNHDATPGHSLFVDHELVRSVIRHGTENGFSLERSGLVFGEPHPPA